MTLSPSRHQREAGSPPTARRRLRRRLSASHVVIAIVVILAFVLNLLVLQDRDSTTLVAIAERPLASGSPVDTSSLRLVPIDSDFEGIDALVTEDEFSGLEGWVLARPIPAGAPIEATALVEPGSRSGLRAMSLPVPIEHAAGGALSAGDRVDVIAVTEGAARFVAVDLEVVSVSETGSGAIGSISSYHLVVNVEPEQALELAEAMAAGPVEILEATGAGRIGDAGG